MKEIKIMTIGAFQYKGSGIYVGVILRDGEKQAVAYGEGEEETLRQSLPVAFPGISIFDEIFVFRMECKRRGANAWPAIKREEPAVQKFAQWERVLWGEYRFVVVENASLVAGSWVYQIIDEYDHTHVVVESKLSKAEQLSPEENVTIDASYEVGKIVSWRGNRYIVVGNHYLSSSDATDLEDANDVFDAAGYHCQLRLIHEEQ